MARRQVTFLIRANAKQFSEAIGRAQNQLKRFSWRTERTGRSMTQNFTLPLALAGGAAIKAAGDFESSFADIRKTVDATEWQFEAMSSQIRDLSKTIPTSVNELNKLGGVAGQLGIEAENIVGFTETLAKLADTTDIVGEQGALQLSRFMNVMGTADRDVDRLASTIVGLGNKFAAMESEILTAATALAPLGNSIGLTEQQVLAFSATIAASGGNLETAGTAFQKTANTMKQAVIESNADLQVFAQTAGMSASSFRKAFKKDAAGALQSFLEGLKRLQEEGGATAQVLERVGLADQRLIREFGKVLGNIDDLNRALPQANDEWQRNTALTEEAQKRYKTFNSRMGILWNRIYDLGIQIGNRLIPSVNKLIEHIKNLTDWFSKLSKDSVENILILAGVLGVGGPLLIGISKVTTAISVLLGGFKSLVLFIPKVISAFETLYLAALMNPVTASIVAATAAVTALGVAAYDSYTDLKKITDEADRLSGIDVANKSWEELKGHIGDIDRQIKTIRDDGGFSWTDPSSYLEAFTTSDDIGRLNAIKKLQMQRDKAAKELAQQKPKIFQTPQQMFANMGMGLDNVLAKPEAPSLIIKPKVKVEPELEGGSGALSEIQKKVRDIMSGVQGELNSFAKQAQFPEIFGDTAGARLDALKSGMKSLIDAGVSPMSTAFQKLKRTYDSFKSSISRVEDIGISASVETSGLENMKVMLEDTRSTAERALGSTKLKFMEFAQDLSSKIVPVITQGLFDIGTAFLENSVAALAAGGSFKDVGFTFLSTLADLAIRVGKIAIAVGLGIEAIRASLSSLNPVVAIAAGAALIALGAAAKGALKAAGSSPATGVSSSGGSLSGTSAAPSLSNRDSTRVFLSNISNNSQSAFQSAMERALDNAQWRVSGGDLQLVLNNSSQNFR